MPCKHIVRYDAIVIRHHPRYIGSDVLSYSYP